MFRLAKATFKQKVERERDDVGFMIGRKRKDLSGQAEFFFLVKEE